MKVSKDAMTPDEFREHAKRMSKYIDFRGCKTKKCIKERIRSKKSKRLNNLLKGNFAFHLLIQAWINPHPVFKKNSRNGR